MIITPADNFELSFCPSDNLEYETSSDYDHWEEIINSDNESLINTHTVMLRFWNSENKVMFNKIFA